VDWKGLTCLFVVILGLVLFLYGANYYDNIVGWVGIYLFIGGILAYVFVWIFRRLIKGAVDQKP
jgi:hypothetical protein